MMTAVPWSGPLAMEIWPRCSSMIFLTDASPSPVPAALVGDPDHPRVQVQRFSEVEDLVENGLDTGQFQVGLLDPLQHVRARRATGGRVPDSLFHFQAGLGQGALDFLFEERGHFPNGLLPL